MSSIEALPVELLVSIVDMLKFRDVIQLSTVSKRLAATINDFYHFHHIRYSNYIKNLTRRRLRVFRRRLRRTNMRDLRIFKSHLGNVSTSGISTIVSDCFLTITTKRDHIFRSVIEKEILPEHRNRCILLCHNYRYVILVYDPKSLSLSSEPMKLPFHTMRRLRSVIYKLQGGSKKREHEIPFSIYSFKVHRDVVPTSSLSHVEICDRFVYTLMPYCNSYYHYASDQTRASLTHFIYYNKLRRGKELYFCKYWWNW